jgi:hypothetical protein
MKKVIISLTISIAVAFVSESCNTRTYDDISGPKTNITYTKDIEPIMKNNCTECHSASSLDQFPPLDSYQDVKYYIEDIINRTEDGSMPQSGPLPSSTINVIKKWRDNGMPE